MTEQMSFEIDVKKWSKIGKSAFFKVHFFGQNPLHNSICKKLHGWRTNTQNFYFICLGWSKIRKSAFFKVHFFGPNALCC